MADVKNSKSAAGSDDPRDAKRLRLRLDDEVHSGARIKVILENGLEQRGVVKWSMNQVAGLRFSKPIPHEMVESVAKLNRVKPAASGRIPVFPGQSQPHPIKVRLD